MSKIKIILKTTAEFQSERNYGTKKRGEGENVLEH